MTLKGTSHTVLASSCYSARSTGCCEVSILSPWCSSGHAGLPCRKSTGKAQENCGRNSLQTKSKRTVDWNLPNHNPKQVFLPLFCFLRYLLRWQKHEQDPRQLTIFLRSLEISQWCLSLTCFLLIRPTPTALIPLAIVSSPTNYNAGSGLSWCSHFRILIPVISSLPYLPPPHSTHIVYLLKFFRGSWREHLIFFLSTQVLAPTW